MQWPLKNIIFPRSLRLDPPASSQPVDLLVVAGEHSGDQHAAALVRRLRARVPGLHVVALGGPALAAQGVQLLMDLMPHSVVGFGDVLRNWGFFKGLFEAVLAWVAQYRPAHVCTVDYPGLNLRLARALRERGLSRKGGGKLGCHHYISPQLWAWKSGRRFSMARDLDSLAVIFPFEKQVYADTPLPVTFVGHPLVIDPQPSGLFYRAQAPVLLCPGSRPKGVARIFPLMLQALAQLQRWQGLAVRACVPYAPGGKEALEAILRHYPGLHPLVDCVPYPQALPASAVLNSAGTMSLICGLAGLPGALAYRIDSFSYWIARRLVKVPYLGMPNLLLPKPLYPEYLQSAATPQALAHQLQLCCQDEGRAQEAQSAALELKRLLQAPDACGPEDWLLGQMGASF